MAYSPFIIALLIILQSTIAAYPAHAAKLSAGPMAGTSAMRSVTIWIQTDSPAFVRLEYWSGQKQKKLSQSIELKQQDDFAGRITLTNLDPGTEYLYRVLLDNEPVVGRVYHVSTQSLWQWRTDPPNSKVLLGSCAYTNEVSYDRPNDHYGGYYEIFNSMALAKPDLTIWLGDNVYFREVDYDSKSGMAYRYRHDRSLPQLQALLNTGQHAAIWDDHDYGPNDSNSSFVLKSDSLLLFERYWANPSYGLPDVPGIFTVVHHNDADFFLLDDRWYRDSDKLSGGGNKSMFGERQMSWLKNALLNSTANFKFIAGGNQFLNDQNRWEGWQNFPEERRKFISWISENKLEGIMFLSGDRHQTELLRLDRPHDYPLFELTCSPLTAGTHNLDDERTNPMRVEGTLVGERNYCSVEFSGSFLERRIKLRSHGINGKVLWEYNIPKKQLSKEHVLQ